jgi:hypothetical protein
MRASRATVLVALVAAAFAAFGAAQAGATVTPSFSATDVTTCGGTSHVTVTIQAQNPDPIHQAADIVLLVDRSGSIGAGVFGTSVKTSLNTLITNAAPAPAGNNIGIIGFSTGAQTITGLTGNEPALHTAVNGMAYPGGVTETLTGLQAAAAMLAASSRPGAPKVIIVETDGVWNPTTQNPTTEAQNLVAQGISIFAVGVGSGVNPAQLQAIAGGDADHVFSATDYDGLDGALNDALTEIVPAATSASYAVTTAPGFSLVGTPTATVGTVTPSSGGFMWTAPSINSPTGTTVTISYDEQYTGVTHGTMPLASTALLTYTDDTGTVQHADYSTQTIAVDGCNQPPQADAGPDQTVDLGAGSTVPVTLDGSASSDPDSDVLSYAWVEGSTTVSTNVAPTLNLGWGDHTFTLTVTDPYGATSSDDVTVHVTDTTPPSIVFGNDQGTYGLGDVVNISCTASDAGSGLATPSDCGSITGAAYTFGAGTVSVTRSATDNAGNTGSATATFDVVVDAAGLCSLIQQWSDNAGVANSLCVKIDKGHMTPFFNALAAQRGKHIPADKADIIRSLAQAL